MIFSFSKRPLEDIRKLNILLDFSTLEKSEGGCVAVESSRIICEGMFISDIDQELHSLIKVTQIKLVTIHDNISYLIRRITNRFSFVSFNT